MHLVHLQTASSSSQQQLRAPGASAVSSGREDQSEAAPVGGERPASGPRPHRATSGKKPPPAAPPPPWRDSDRRPKDTLRFNYLDNLEPAEGAPKA